MELEKTGIDLKGIVINNSSYTRTKGERAGEKVNQVDLLVDGHRSLLTVPVEKPLPKGSLQSVKILLIKNREGGLFIAQPSQ